MACSLPIYSPAMPCPIYSATAGPNEQSLLHSPVPGHSRHTGIFVRKEHILTVVLQGQKENSRRPSFGRGALLSGTLLLESPETVTAVNVKLQGTVESNSSHNGYSRLEVLDETSSLYAQGDNQTRCLSAIPFLFRFPRRFENNGVHYPLPPSCDITLPNGSFLKCTYSLTVSLSVALHRSTPFFVRAKNLFIELEYRERTRPSRPGISEPSLFSTIKICPEEWLQLPIALTVKPDSRPSDIYCDLFVPSVGVFASPDTIPFHLQLSGTINSLRKLLLFPSKLDRIHNQIIRVYVLRQITVHVSGDSPTKVKMNTILWEASLRPLPPDISDLSQTLSSNREDVLNWEGELQLQDITTPTFDVGSFMVTYFVAIELTPPETSSVNRCHYGFPIKLTTDTS
ncbi:hypothetical protein B0H11DRAFT_1988309 [Mycena galericulata]|nr:hypothetical protein B0H11DRAFT_1988309 [Mycena galericulata]